VEELRRLRQHLSNESRNGRESKVEGFWTGMVNELHSNRADMIVAPLSVSPLRNRAIDFTKPFKYPTLTILMRKKAPMSNLGSFLQPFGTTLWILMFFFVNVIALVMFLFERFSPFGWLHYPASQSDKYADSLQNYCSANGAKKSLAHRNPLDSCFCRFCRPKRRDGESGDRAVTLPQALWLSWGIVLSTGPGEHLPRSFSARVFTMIWAALAMVIVSAYTGMLYLLVWFFTYCTEVVNYSFYERNITIVSEKLVSMEISVSFDSVFSASTPSFVVFRMFTF
jgi:glutamate receptor ionotropic, NMDA 1